MIEALCIIDLESEEGAEWLEAHTPTLCKKQAGPRALAERALAEIMLADKEVHTGRDLGAKPRYDIPLGAFSHWRAPELPANDAKPFDHAARVDRAFVQDQADACRSLWRYLIERLAYDSQGMWGTTKEARRDAVLFFTAPSGEYAQWRDDVCDLADCHGDDLTKAYGAGTAKKLADSAIGRERWHTRQINRQASAVQPDLFYSMGIR